MNKSMPKLIDIRTWYIKNGMPIKCRYCGSDSNLTKDHLTPKSRVSKNVRLERWKNKDIDPQTYYKQFALACSRCNLMKHNLNEKEFIEHIKKIASII